MRRNRCRDAPCVQERIGLPNTVEADCRIGGEPMIVGPKLVLSR